jgi:hypothetical protein
MARKPKARSPPTIRRMVPKSICMVKRGKVRGNRTRTAVEV